MSKKFLFAAAVAITAFASSANAAIYDTTAIWNGSSAVSPFGHADTATYGQTFVTPSDNVLDSFTFYLRGEANLQFQAEVYAWNGSLLGGAGGGATGPALFTSSPITFGPTGGAFIAQTINTGGLSLTAGAAYVALFTISGPDPSNYTNSSSTDVWGLSSGSHSANNGGGGFVFFNNGSNYSALNTQAWDNFGDFGDSAWTAVFSGGQASVPEPLTISLFGAGVAGAVAMRRRKKA